MPQVAGAAHPLTIELQAVMLVCVLTTHPEKVIITILFQAYRAESLRFPDLSAPPVMDARLL